MYDYCNLAMNNTFQMEKEKKIQALEAVCSFVLFFFKV